jgi:hypothetical protein
MVKLKDLVEDLELGKVYTDKDRPPFQVKEGQKRQSREITAKFDKAYLNFAKEVRDVIKMIDRYQGDKTDGKIIDKAYSKGLVPLDKLMKSWNSGQQKNPNIDEARGTCWVGYQQKGMKDKGGKMVPNCVKEITEIFYEVDGKGYGYTFEHINDGKLNEAEYQGRKVKLGKPMQGDAKKFKVYVKNPKGNTVKVTSDKVVTLKVEL